MFRHDKTSGGTASAQRASHLQRMAWALAASCHSSLQSFRRLCACRRYNPQAEGVRAYLRHKQGVQVRVGGSSLVLFRAAALRLPSARSPTAVCISSTALSTARGDADRPMPSCAAGRGFVDPAVPDGKGASMDSTCAVRRVLQPCDRASMKAARAALEG